MISVTAFEKFKQLSIFYYERRIYSLEVKADIE